nr:hypothetical protein CFP56_60288 [Quercus suber]
MAPCFELDPGLVGMSQKICASEITKQTLLAAVLGIHVNLRVSLVWRIGCRDIQCSPMDGLPKSRPSANRVADPICARHYH